MRNLEIFWFEDVNALNEPVLFFPLVGRISMRQFFILGIAAIFSYLIFLNTHNILSIIPLGIGAFLAFTKPKVATTEQMIVCFILFLIRKYCCNNKRTKSTKFPNSSKKINLADSLIEISQEDKIKTITLSDLSRPYRFKVKLFGPTGKVLSNKKSRVYLDGTYLDTLTTDINGELETIIVPKTPGFKKISINSDEQIEPIFFETIEIKTNTKNLA